MRTVLVSIIGSAGVECLLVDGRKRGVKAEDTHITDPEILRTLPLHHRPNRHPGLTLHNAGRDGPQCHQTKSA